MLPLTFGGSVPDSARDSPTTRRPTRITLSSPSSSQTVTSGRDTNKCVFFCSLSPLNLHLSHLATNPLERLCFRHRRMAIGHTNTNISISSCDDPTDATDTIPDRSTRRYAWPSPCRTHPPSAQAVDRSSSHNGTAWTPAPPLRYCRRATGHTNSDQAHLTEKDRFSMWDRARVERVSVEQQYRGWKRSARKWCDRRERGKLLNRVFNAILISSAERPLKRTDYCLFLSLLGVGRDTGLHGRVGDGSISDCTVYPLMSF